MSRGNVPKSVSVDASSSAGYERGPHWELRSRRQAGSLDSAGSVVPRENPTAVEVHEWVQSSHCHQHDNTLRHGHLLRWMDITACLSGSWGALECVGQQ